MKIGIDLGTTHSVMAIRGRVDFVDGYPPGRYLEDCDVTIIPSPLGDYTFPSIVWVDPDDPENIKFGYDARMTAEEGDSPIMFSKRKMGTDEKLKVSGYEFTAKEVATMFLRYLKESAEKALGRPVEIAVVTHPAYFDPSQKEETREAAEKAGFVMSLPEQLMMEPVAAALAYLETVEQEPITVMTYDLGGGTFDVSILEKREEIISMKSYDGDQLLGGYNFDRALVQWIIEKASAKGRKIPYDPENPEDRGRRARLLIIAESLKIRLSETRTDLENVPVRIPDVLVDEQGRTVPVLEKINRKEFTELIMDYLKSTFECCHRAITKAGIEQEDLDIILLVGGSTWGPWVTSALSEEFEGINIRKTDPDLHVVAGAAIRADEIQGPQEGYGLKLIPDIPERSALPIINVAGKVIAEDKSPLDDELRSSLRIFLESNGTTYDPASLSEEGTFLFKHVELDHVEPNEDDENNFTLKIIDDDGLERMRHEFTVTFDEEIGGPEIYTVLPKQLSIETADGLVPLAEEGVELPAKIEEEFRRLQNDPFMSVKIFLEKEHVGNIEITDIPENAGKGSIVKLEVKLTRRNEMNGIARIYTRGGTEAGRSKVRIVFPPVTIPELSKLMTKYEDLESDRIDRIETSQDPQHRAALSGKGSNLSEKIDKLLAEQEPDRQEIQQALRELNQVVNPVEEQMDPPRARFLDMIDECSYIIEEMEQGPRKHSYENRLRRISAEGDRAFTRRNHKCWARNFENLDSLYRKLLAREAGGAPAELQPADILKEMYQSELDRLRAHLENKRELSRAHPEYERYLRARCSKIEENIDSMERDIEKVPDDMEPRQAYHKLHRATRMSKHLAKEIQNIDKELERISK